MYVSWNSVTERFSCMTTTIALFPEVAMRRIALLILLLTVSCTPIGTGKDKNNNNANNLNNINNLNNFNNVNNGNNINNQGNRCTHPSECEPWQTCSVGGYCVNLDGRCSGDESCAFWQVCGPTWFCEVREGYCEDEGDCDPGETCGEDHLCFRAGPTSCNFTYDTDFPPPVNGALKGNLQEMVLQAAWPDLDMGPVEHGEPSPPYFWLMTPPPIDGIIPPPITMPGYSDNMPLFSRAQAWNGQRRCYETPSGVRELTEAEAFDFYRDIVQVTLGVTMNVAPNFRNVVGIRGAYPGRISWHRNSPDHFNDTLVLMWIDSNGVKNVREFPVNTDTGDNNYTSTSSLLPNRLYRYKNGWHRDYNALSMNEHAFNYEYNTADDANANGHWDCDRNGWLNTGSTLDYIRVGSAHNIHMGSMNGPLGTARVAGWSAGCQVIPGMANWTAFINHAWTTSGARVDYWLIDARDIDKSLWGQSCAPDGSHECPFRVTSFPYSHSHTTVGGQSRFGVYNCSTANEQGPEIVYEVKVPTHGTLHVSVDCVEPVDIDVHLLVMDDPRACLTRAHISFTRKVVPGRYLVVADTFVSSNGTINSGPYTLNINLTN